MKYKIGDKFVCKNISTFFTINKNYEIVDIDNKMYILVADDGDINSFFDKELENLFTLISENRNQEQRPLGEKMNELKSGDYIRNIKNQDSFTIDKKYQILDFDIHEEKYVFIDDDNDKRYFSLNRVNEFFIKVENKQAEKNHRNYNIGSSNYAEMNIQPWDIWKDWKLDPWDADIVKRISRTKKIEGKSFAEARIEDYEKIKHICDEKISQLKEINE